MSEVYTNLASAAESGMDFSSRWLQDGRHLSSIRTTDILPVDLNAILCSNEATLAKLYSIVGVCAWWWWWGGGSSALCVACGEKSAYKDNRKCCLHSSLHDTHLKHKQTHTHTYTQAHYYYQYCLSHTGSTSRSVEYESAFKSRQAKFNAVFWNESLGYWSDVVMSTGQHNPNFYLSHLTPLAWNCVERNTTQELAVLRAMEVIISVCWCVRVLVCVLCVVLMYVHVCVRACIILWSMCVLVLMSAVIMIVTLTAASFFTLPSPLDSRSL